MIRENPYQSPSEAILSDRPQTAHDPTRWGVFRLLLGVWSPLSISTAARRSSIKAAVMASTVTSSLYLGAVCGVVGGCGAEPFQGWTDCFEAIGILTAIFTAIFVSPYLLAVSPLLLACRMRRLNEHYLKLLLIAPLAFRLPYTLLLAALFLEFVRDSHFEFMQIEKPFFVSDEYATGFENAGLALGSIFIILLIALALRSLIGRRLGSQLDRPAR